MPIGDMRANQWRRTWRWGLPPDSMGLAAGESIENNVHPDEVVAIDQLLKPARLPGPVRHQRQGYYCPRREAQVLQGLFARNHRVHFQGVFQYLFNDGEFHIEELLMPGVPLTVHTCISGVGAAPGVSESAKSWRVLASARLVDQARNLCPFIPVQWPSSLMFPFELDRGGRNTYRYSSQDPAGLSITIVTILNLDARS